MICPRSGLMREPGEAALPICDFRSLEGNRRSGDSIQGWDHPTYTHCFLNAEWHKAIYTSSTCHSRTAQKISRKTQGWESDKRKQLETPAVLVFTSPCPNKAEGGSVPPSQLRTHPFLKHVPLLLHGP